MPPKRPVEAIDVEKERRERAEKRHKKAVFLHDRLRTVHKNELSSWAPYLRGKKLKTRVNARDTAGFRRLATLTNLLDSVPGHPRHESQIDFHEAWTATVLPHLFGEEWAMKSADIRRTLNTERYESQHTLVMTPRRWGKTIAVTQFVAALMLACPGIKIVCFSSRMRQSSAILDQVVKFLTNPDWANGEGLARIVGRDKEHLWVAETALDPPSMMSQAARNARALSTTSELHVLPGGNNPTGVRGTGGQVVVMEEAAFMTPGLFQAIAPLLSRLDTTLIAISTADGVNNFYSKLFHAKSNVTGRYLFNRKMVQTICAECDKDKKKKEEAHIIGCCEHCTVRLPPWKSSKEQGDLLQVMGDSRMFDQEMAGIILESSDEHIFSEYAAQFFELSRTPSYECGAPHSRPVSTVYISVDPARGGSCEWGLASFIVGPEHVTVSCPSSSCPFRVPWGVRVRCRGTRAPVPREWP